MAETDKPGNGRRRGQDRTAPRTLSLDEIEAAGDEQAPATAGGGGDERESTSAPHSLDIRETEEVIDTPLAQEALARSSLGIGRVVGWIVTGVALLAGIWIADIVAGLVGNPLDWRGWGVLAAATMIGLPLIALVIRELRALGRLERKRHERLHLEAAIEASDVRRLSASVDALERAFQGRAECEWPMARYRERAATGDNPLDRVGYFERDVIAPLDAEAERLILRAARRTTVITATSPFALIDMAASFAINLMTVRRIASLYGVDPGLMGSLRLLRWCFMSAVAAAALDLTDDTLGNLVGSDLVAKLSRRAGIGVLNGLLTCRLGVAAMDLLRPIPWRLEHRPGARSLFRRAVMSGDAPSR